MKSFLTTSMIIYKNGKILLGEKKRGFGMGRYVDVGGKVEPTETVRECAVRETMEEVQITPINFKKVAICTFRVFYKGEWWDMINHTFLAKNFIGVPTETDEIRPEWFAIDNIPYTKMWCDNPYWLPIVLQGQKVIAFFELDKDENLVSHNLKVVKTLH